MSRYPDEPKSQHIDLLVAPLLQPRSRGLKTKLVYIMMGVGAFPLMLAMIFSYIQGNKSLQNVIGSSFKALAYETSTKIDLLIQQQIAHDIRLTRHPAIILSVKEQNRRFGDLDLSRIESRLAKEADLWAKKDASMQSILQNPAAQALQNHLLEDAHLHRSTRALFVTDSKGILISSINFFPGYINTQQPFGSQTVSGGLDHIFVGDVYKDTDIGQYVFNISMPIQGGGKEPIGFLHRVYLVKEFFSSFVEPILFGETGHVMLINSGGVVLDCPILPTGFKLADSELVKNVTRPEADWVLTQGDGHGGRELSIIGFSPLMDTNKTLSRYTGQKWFTFAWQSSEELFAPTQKLFLWISSAGIISIFLIAAMGSLASEKIVEPIKQLQKAAVKIGHGEKVEPLDIKTGDEIELLAHDINTMNRMLEEAFSGLERQVQSKTREVLYLKDYTESILMSVPDVLLIFCPDMKIEYGNASFANLIGLSNGDFIGKTLEELDSGFKSQWENLACDLAMRTGNIARNSSRSRRVGEHIIYCYEAKDPLEPGSVVGAPEAQPMVIFGERIFAYQFFDVSIKVEETRRIGLLMREITEEKKLMDQLTRAEKLSGLGTLAAGIAHEMNSPLYSIMGFTEAIKDEKDIVKIQKYASKVLNSSKYMASIILNLSGYTRSNIHDEAREININERLDAAVEIAMMASHTNDIKIEKDYRSVPLLKAKPEEIQQVFVNIVKNAVQAMNGKGRLTISSNQLNGNIIVRIKDTGPGIPPEHLSRIFDPFFTTKKQGEGTGLGLNIVHRIVEKYGGGISVESQAGQGAAFIIAFPFQTREPSLRNVKQEPDTARKGA